MFTKLLRKVNYNTIKQVRNLRSTSKFVQNDDAIEELKIIEENVFDNKRVEKIDSTKLLLKKAKGIINAGEQKKTEKPERNFDTELNLSYKKLPLHDPLLSTLMLLARSKKRRKQKNQIVVEGRRLIIDALECGLKLDYLMFTNKEQLALIKTHLQGLTDAEIIKVPYSDLNLWTGLTTCPGLMGIFTRDTSEIEVHNDDTRLPITVICDNVREPSNLGSIIRSCAAVPCKEIIALKGCTDPWDSKCLRSGAGGHFRIPIKGPYEWETLKHEMPEDFSFYIAENNPQRTNTIVKRDLVKPYHQLNFNKSENLVLVIGGETHGVDKEIYQFLNETSVNKGNYLYIPLAEGVDSLNTGSAISILLFEMKRQMTTNVNHTE